METIKTKNALIEGTMLGYEGHGIFSFFLYLDYGDSGHQGAGGYGLGGKSGFDLIEAVIKTVGVQTWEDLKGKHIRAKAERGKVHAIGNLLTDDWLDFAEFFKKYKDENY